MEPSLESVTLSALARYFLRLGAVGFGGPIALAGRMQRELVDERRWISTDEYLEGLTLAQLSPGPLAAQLAMYLGWVRFGALGAAVVGVSFVLPSFLMVVGLAHAYLHYGGGWISGAFYGVGAAVIAIIARSSQKLAKLTLGTDKLLWALAAVSAVVTAVEEAEVVWLFIVSGVLALAVRERSQAGSTLLGALPLWLVTGAHGPSPTTVIGQIAWLFTKSGLFVFGSGLAIVPFLYDGVVHQYGWLDEQQFRDAVAVAMITPGPVVITSGFIGYLTAGLLGATVAATCTFFPPFLVVVFAAGTVRRAAKRPRFKAFIAGVTASAAGAIAGSAFILGRRAIVDVPTGIIALCALAVLSTKRKVPEPLVIVVAGLVGVLILARR